MMESKTVNMKIDSVLKAVLEELGGTYEYVKHLGGGEFSNVYLVKHKASGENYALKIMDYHYLIQRLKKEDLADSKSKFNEIKKRFVIEAKIYGKIDHRHIVKILDTGFITNDTNDIEIPFIVMNYIKGSSLAEVLKKEAPFEVNRALAIAKSLLSVIDVIHQNNIIHRDIKPANIMIEEETGEAIIIDFGIAKDIVGGTRLTTTGAFLGSPVYMAPEQFTDSSKVGPEIDTYAFGVVLFEMLTGELPYKGNNFMEVMNAHQVKPVPNILDVNPELPVGIEDILFKAMAKNPAYRYRNAQEFLKDLQDVGKKKRRLSRRQKNRYTYLFYLFVAVVAIALIILNPFGARAPKVETKTTPVQDSNVQVPKIKDEEKAKPAEPGQKPQQVTPEEEFAQTIQAVKKNIEKEDFAAAGDALGKARLIKKDNEEIKQLSLLIAEKKQEYELKNGENLCNTTKGNIDLKKYLEFAAQYPQSRFLNDLKDRLKKADGNLPPEKYWQGPLQSNSKGYYEAIFGPEGSGRRMIYIPAKKIWIDKYEVSNLQFKRYLKDENIKAAVGTGSKYILEGDEYPAAVSYNEAEKYCRRYGFRLPTAEEWQYIAGKGTYTYPWGNELPDSGDICRANFDSLEGALEKDGFSGTAPVKSFAQYSSPFDAVNMAGNVWEWVQGIILKGGGFFSSVEDLAIDKTVSGRENDREGFRCVKDENNDRGI
ncbi:MAG: bifunctional serine/threonine-protein kinase/formylglycine-generating enzyme family protein [Candidatus Aminicenantes bacterium]|nr:bifunctional serine/threonine-protein kinase/formylglycine-generating enzyme family protein [Candidatus Aminicenantes bacterium]